MYRKITSADLSIKAFALLYLLLFYSVASTYHIYLSSVRARERTKRTRPRGVLGPIGQPPGDRRGPRLHQVLLLNKLQCLEGL